MNAEVIPFKPKLEHNANTGKNVRIRQHENRTEASTKNHKPKPLTLYAVVGLDRALRSLGSTISLPVNLERKLKDPDYNLVEDCPSIGLLDEWEQAFLLYEVIQTVHDGWVHDHSNEFFSERYRGNEALFLPLQLIGDVGFFQYMSDSFLDAFQKLGLDKGMKLLAGGVRTYPYLERVRIIRRNLYCKQYGIGSVKTLQKHIAHCNYSSLSKEIKTELRSNNRLVFTMTQDVVAYNPGKFQ